jgi:D-alanyl-D-alanine carboxypeptidase
MRYDAPTAKGSDLNATQAVRRLRAAFAVTAFLALGASALAATAAPGPTAEPVQGPYIVADVDSGRVIESHDALRPWYPASTTKLMTVYVTFEAIRAGEITFDSEVHYSANAANQPPSKMGFKPGTTLTLDNALKMMMVKSANDIAVAVAETVGGSVAGFADRMNAAAKQLGMTRSHFVNPNGLPDDNHYTTARDMAIVARALLTEFPQYRDYFDVPAIEIGGRVLKNLNRLLVRYPGATGMKTGFICDSGFNLVASAKRGDREVLAVVFGQYGEKVRNEYAAKLLDDGFNAPPPTDQTFETLDKVTTGAAYDTPFNMRPYVCGPKRVKVAALIGDNGAPVSYLTPQPLDIGPPVEVSAVVPIDYGDPEFVAPVPRPRPEPTTIPELLNAYAPGDGASASAPAEAIGAAAGSARPLVEIPPQ